MADVRKCRVLRTADARSKPHWHRRIKIGLLVSSRAVLWVAPTSIGLRFALRRAAGCPRVAQGRASAPAGCASRHAARLAQHRRRSNLQRAPDSLAAREAYPDRLLLAVPERIQLPAIHAGGRPQWRPSRASRGDRARPTTGIQVLDRRYENGGRSLEYPPSRFGAARFAVGSRDSTPGFR